MAGTKFAYVKSFELPDPLLPNTFIVVRLDGHSFHRFTDVHDFMKPNDERGLQLMDHAARDLMKEYKDVVLAFGESDEYSFLLRRSTALYDRRQSKILTTLVSYFTSSYTFHWNKYFPSTTLQYPPSFDGRLILYPRAKEVRDYFSWRQADTHINNLYNTAFWALVQQGGRTTAQAHEELRGTVSSQKNEILFSRFGINYNNLPARYRKGSVLVREVQPSEGANAGDEKLKDHMLVHGSTRPTVEITVSDGGGDQAPTEERNIRKGKRRNRSVVCILHVDIIGEIFWDEHSTLLNE